jgi:hypothetical protein
MSFAAFAARIAGTHKVHCMYAQHPPYVEKSSLQVLEVCNARCAIFTGGARKVHCSLHKMHCHEWEGRCMYRMAVCRYSWFSSHMANNPLQEVAMFTACREIFFVACRRVHRSIVKVHCMYTQCPLYVTKYSFPEEQ